MTFKKAVKRLQKLRLALAGVTGGGKTMTALKMAAYIANRQGGRVAMIDTEHGSGSLYSDEFDFDVLELHSFSAENYLHAIRDAEQAGYAVLIIDSFSHLWEGKDGIMEFKDQLASRAGANSFTAWGKAGEKLKEVIEKILSSKMHVICTMRSTMEHVQEKDDKGKTTVRKVGLSPVMRKGIEYEFTVVGDVDESNFTTTKTRCSALKDRRFFEPGADVAKILLDWLEAKALEPEPEKPSVLEPINKRWAALRDEHGLDNRILIETIAYEMDCKFSEIEGNEEREKEYDDIVSSFEQKYGGGTDTEPTGSVRDANEKARSHREELEETAMPHEHAEEDTPRDGWTDEQLTMIQDAGKRTNTKEPRMVALLNAAETNGWTFDFLIDKIIGNFKPDTKPTEEETPAPQGKPPLSF